MHLVESDDDGLIAFEGEFDEGDYWDACGGIWRAAASKVRAPRTRSAAGRPPTR